MGVRLGGAGELEPKQREVRGVGVRGRGVERERRPEVHRQRRPVRRQRRRERRGPVQRHVRQHERGARTLQLRGRAPKRAAAGGGREGGVARNAGLVGAGVQQRGSSKGQ